MLRGGGAVVEAMLNITRDRTLSPTPLPQGEGLLSLKPEAEFERAAIKPLSLRERGGGEGTAGAISTNKPRSAYSKILK